LKILRVLGAAAAVLVAALVATLAIPVETWRTGDQGLAPLDEAPQAPTPPMARRLWIDTDAACGIGARTDPDDCLAIALLAQSSGFEITGISTVFGNASRDAVDYMMRSLLNEISSGGRKPVPLHTGASVPLAEEAVPREPAHDALRAALEQGPLTIVALGPLTNVASVLREHPSLRSRVSRLVAVMGRRPGHLFHPAEGAEAGSLLGHGPVFRDLNFVLDPHAAAQILAMKIPISLVPYDAARGIEMTAEDLNRLEAHGGARAWVASRSRAWLDYWREDIGRQGFFPFDLLAAAYVAQPELLRCTSARAWMGKDETLFVPFWRPAALLVGPKDARGTVSGKTARVLYCGHASEGLKRALMSRWLGSPY
jgi:inosine-uridine nucleoside N-ribohydrolase